MKTKYTIFVNINNRTFVYNVNNYDFKDGFIIIFDNKIRKYRKFDSRICEIIEDSKNDR